MASTTEPQLTPKQERVRKMLADNKSVREIAKAMGTKPNSVYNHIRKIRALGIDVSHPDGAGSNGATAPTGIEHASEALEEALVAIEHALDAEKQLADGIVMEVAAIDGEIAELQARRSELEVKRSELQERGALAHTRLERLVVAERAITES